MTLLTEWRHILDNFYADLTSFNAKGKKIAFLATGHSVGESKKAVEMLYKKDIFCSLYNFHTIKPIDLESLEKIASKYELIFTIEEHNIIGGLGSAVSEVLTTKKNRPKQFFIGVKDTYKNTGSYREVLEKSGISAEKIYQKVITEVKAI